MIIFYFMMEKKIKSFFEMSQKIILDNLGNTSENVLAKDFLKSEFKPNARFLFHLLPFSPICPRLSYRSLIQRLSAIYDGFA